MTSASEFISGDASQQSALAARQSIMLHELKTVIAIPLRERRTAPGSEKPAVDGVLYLDSRSISRNLSGVSHDVLRALARSPRAPRFTSDRTTDDGVRKAQVFRIVRRPSALPRSQLRTLYFLNQACIWLQASSAASLR